MKRTLPLLCCIFGHWLKATRNLYPTKTKILFTEYCTREGCNFKKDWRIPRRQP